MAKVLGVKYLDKLEKVVDYRSTFRVIELIWSAVGIAICRYKKENNMNDDEIFGSGNNILKAWYMFYKWGGLLKLHKMGIRMGNLELQLKSLQTFAPLFPITGKDRYGASVTRFLKCVSQDPELQKRLRAAPSINLTQINHFMAYDEAIEVFGVKFVKQNIPGHVRDSEYLEELIKSVQTERERMLMLYDEFVNDNTASRNPRTVNDHKQALWKLVDEILLAFNDPSLQSTVLFKEATQLTSEGYQLLFTCYEKGVDRLETIVRQDINLTESRVTKGRRRKNLNPLKVKDIKDIGNRQDEETMEVEETVIEMNLESDEEPTIIQTDETQKSKRHIPTPEEEEHLRVLEDPNNQAFFPAEIARDLVEKLKMYTDYWTKDRIYGRWYNRNIRKKNT